MYEVLEEDKSEKVGQDLNRYQESVVLFCLFCGFFGSKAGDPMAACLKKKKRES